MKTRFIAIGGMLLIGFVAYAQDYEQIKKQINSIKKSSQYIYGETTADSEEEARDIAESILYQEINAWVAKKKSNVGGNIVVNNKKELQTTFSMPRGNMYRCFIYVKKSDIIPTESVDVIEATSPVEAEKVVHTIEPVNCPEAVNVLLPYKDYYNMVEKVKQLKEEGKITHYARYGSLEKPEIYYLAIYNKQGQVVAYLTPGTTRTNIKTGQPDKVENYSGCGAIGFSVKE